MRINKNNYYLCTKLNNIEYDSIRAFSGITKD